jgi:hypothetical protein
MAQFTIVAIHKPHVDRYLAVRNEMQEMGAPTIEVVDCGDHYMALEGSHRLAAAKDLGLVPMLTVRDQDEMIDITGYDWFDPEQWAETEYAAGEVAGELRHSQNVPYSFEGVSGKPSHLQTPLPSRERDDGHSYSHHAERARCRNGCNSPDRG